MPDTGGPIDQTRLDLFAYLTAPQADQYIRIMRLLSGTILTQELNATEIAATLTADGFPISEDEAEARCERLVDLGNVIRSIRNYRVSTIAEIKRTRSRYQASKLGARVTASSDQIINATDGAREVARELLGVIAEQLGRILEAVDEPGVDGPERIAAAVSTAFNAHREFSDSLRDFNSYLARVLSKYDIVGDDFEALKGNLVNYVDIIRNEVRLHAPQIFQRLDRLRPHLGEVVSILDSWQLLRDDAAERGPGRNIVDWEHLDAWYAVDGEMSGPAAFRAATDQALNHLLVNAKRILNDAGSGPSRREDFLRLAKTFSEATEEEAHRVAADTFGLYSWRHLLFGDGEAVSPPSDTSWWDGPRVEVPVTLRERGDRQPRGRIGAVVDASMERSIAYLRAVEEVAERRRAAAELIAAGRLDRVRLSLGAQRLFEKELTRMTDDVSVNRESGFTLTRELFDGTTALNFDEGVLIIHGMCFTATRVGKDVDVQDSVIQEATG